MTRRSFVLLAAGTLGLVALLVRPETAAAAPKAAAADAALDRALRELVEMPGGPPGAIAVVQRGSSLRVHAFGVAAVGEQGRPRKSDYMRIASVAKAFSGAVACRWSTRASSHSTIRSASVSRASRSPGMR